MNDVYGFHVSVPDEVNEHFQKNFSDKRVLYSINGSETRPGGIMKTAKYYYLMLNRQFIKKNNLHRGQKVTVKIEKDTSEYGMPMPEELQAVFDQDEHCKAYFDTLTPGKQRNLIYLVAKIKSPDKRINKALAIAEHLNEVEGKLNFKMLNETIKKYNNMTNPWA
ncbi:MAG: YdeI/OmpD-associated family protein [Bacteroidia bacterium]